MGDPETQSLLHLMESDLYEVIEAAMDERLNEIQVEWKDEVCINVVLASSGYPGNFTKGFPITIDESIKDNVFLAGAKLENRVLKTSGGRVLSVIGTGKTLEEAREEGTRYEVRRVIGIREIIRVREIRRKSSDCWISFLCFEYHLLRGWF